MLSIWIGERIGKLSSITRRKNCIELGQISVLMKVQKDCDDNSMVLYRSSCVHILRQ